MSAKINYAQAAGIESTPAAVVFAVIYVPLFAWYALQSITRPTSVFFMLAFFSLIRAVAFTIRAILAGIDSAAENRDLVIANQVIYGIGFLGVLWSAYCLVLDRELVSDAKKTRNPIANIARNRHLYRMCLSVAVILGVVGTIKISATQGTPSDITLGNDLRKASIILFVVLVAILVYLTGMFIMNEQKTAAHSYRQGNESIGLAHGTKILGLIAVLLLAREAFLAATIGDLAKQEREVYWYPFSAVTELLAVCLYLTPGLVPPRSELPH